MTEPGTAHRLTLVNRALKVLVLPPVVVYILLALPIVGNLIVIGFSTRILRCHIDAGGPQSCLFLGNDIGDINYGYGVGSIVLGITNPFLAAEAYSRFISLPVFAGWVFLVFATVIFRERMKRDMSPTISGGDEDRDAATLRWKLAAALLALVLLVVALWWMQRDERASSEAEAQEAAAAVMRDDATVVAKTDEAVSPPPPIAVAATPDIASTDTAMTGATKPFDAPMVATEAASANGCSFPMLDAAKQPFKLYAAGAYSGRRLGMQVDQSGHEAGRIDVGVNRPGEAVALMLGSYDPTVWHIGWTSGTRIVAVLVGGYHRQVVTGLPKDVPLIVSTYDNKGPCGYFYVTADKAPTLNPIARRAFGRGIDMLYPASQGSVLVGAAAGGMITDASAQDDAAFRIGDDMAAGEAGLAYAVSRGWLREAMQSDADAWISARASRPQADVPPIAGGVPAGRMTVHNGYVVLKPFRLPEGLYGAHSATFFVPKGVARPTGNLGHSVLYDFNTLTCAGTFCESR